MKKISITTKTGDKGYSHLFSGEQVLKNSSRLETYGDLDELVSFLSIARHAVQNTNLKEDILWIQQTLFTVGNELATTQGKLHKLKKRIDTKTVEKMETKRLALESQVEVPDNFVIPGNTIAAAYLDYARTISRRLERKVVDLNAQKEIDNSFLLIWLNRLSDYLYLMARLEEKKPLLVNSLDQLNY